MSLSCDCGFEWEGEPGTWAYFAPGDFEKFPETGRRKRCGSCGKLIDHGADCLRFKRVRAASTDIEFKIMGEEIEMAPLWMCEDCGEKYLNLAALGYCIGPREDTRELLREYWERTDFDPAKYAKVN